MEAASDQRAIFHSVKKIELCKCSALQY